MKIRLYILLIALFSFVNIFQAKADKAAKSEVVQYTLEDRDRMIRLEQRFDALEKIIDKRFEQIDKRIDDFKSLIVLISSIFSVYMAANLGFAFWDRRTI